LELAVTVLLVADVIMLISAIDNLKGVYVLKEDVAVSVCVAQAKVVGAALPVNGSVEQN
jgi:hypothetical protein